MGVEVLFADPELSSGISENGLLDLRPTQRWLMSDRPENIVLEIAQITEHTPVVTGHILAPSGHRQLVATAITAAATANHHMIPTVGQQLDSGALAIGIGEDPQFSFMDS